MLDQVEDAHYKLVNLFVDLWSVFGFEKLTARHRINLSVDCVSYGEIRVKCWKLELKLNIYRFRIEECRFGRYVTIVTSIFPAKGHFTLGEGS